MRRTTRTMTIAAALSVVFGLCPRALAQADDPSGYGDGYQSGAYGRVRFAEGGATIVRADGDRGETAQASVNAPIFPGDTVRTDGSQRVEIQLAGRSIVRIDRGGEVVFQSLPNPSAKYQDNSVLALRAGAVRITSRSGDKDEFRVDTHDASAYLLGAGEFRIESDDRGGTRVASLRGVAEVVGNDASVLVRGGMSTAAVAGSAPEAPRPYSAFATDGFDRWCDARDDDERGHDRYAALDDDQRKDLPDEVQPYYGELSRQGNWAVDPNYGSVWYPTGVPSGWRPYNDGYWSYGPGGYFWVSYEPWGWAPYHYGNWQWNASHGWCWVPGPVFAGAWVSWSWGSLYVGWAPLDYWGRPGWVGGPYYSGYYDPGCWTFVNYGNIYARNINRYAVPIGTVRDDLRQATVVARAPRIDPRRVAESPVWRDRALRQVADDHAAQMRPSRGDRPPGRRISEVQDQLMKRPSQGMPAPRAPRGTITAPSIDPRGVAPKSRRILEDPRSSARTVVHPETRDDVRDLYQRMSRPRETRGQDAASPRREHPSSRTQQMREAPGAARLRAEAPRGQAPRAEAPRSQTPREPAPRVETPRPPAPHAQAPRTQAPRTQAPRAQAPRSQAAPQAKPKHGDKH